MVPDVLPCYVVCDVSFSMSDHLDEVNAGMREFRGAVHADRRASTQIRLCVVVFAERPVVLQPLLPALDQAELIEPRQESGSDFGSAFTLLHHTVERDVRSSSSPTAGRPIRPGLTRWHGSAPRPRARRWSRSDSVPSTGPRWTASAPRGSSWGATVSGWASRWPPPSRGRPCGRSTCERSTVCPLLVHRPVATCFRRT
jgi:hypothetical protein